MVAHSAGILAEKLNGISDYVGSVPEIIKVGMQIRQGEPVVMIYCNNESKLDKTRESFHNAD
jgi:thymidine phosphorylase